MRLWLGEVDDVVVVNVGVVGGEESLTKFVLGGFF